MVRISASLLAANFLKLGKEIKEAEGLVDRFHIDTMDGHFVNNIAFGPTAIKWIRTITDKPLEVHMYFTEPEKLFSLYLEQNIDVLFTPIETTKEIEQIKKKTEEYSCKFGLALNPTTDISCLIPYLEYLDEVLLLTVKPGFGGQKMLDNSTERVSQLSDLRRREKAKFDIIIDGGVNRETYSKFIPIGINEIVIGSAFFRNPQKIEFVREIKDRVTNIK
ncbi:MAG: ribulose-phosphate 3-epimerase [Candidatus Heimdallarchaeaceae archaeon]